MSTDTIAKPQPLSFSMERSALLAALSTVGRATANRGYALPILSGIKISVVDGVVTMTATDLELTIATELRARVHTPGTIVLPGRIAKEVVASVGHGVVDVTVSDDVAGVGQANANTDIRLLPADEFPIGWEYPKLVATLDAAVLRDAIDKVLPTVSGDNDRPILCAVMFDNFEGRLRLVGTDSYRLSVRDLPRVKAFPDQLVEQFDNTSRKDKVAVGPFLPLVPARALLEVARILPEEGKVQLFVSDNPKEPVRALCFVVGATAVSTRLVEGEYPNYRGLIPPSYPIVARFNKARFLAALAKTTVMARDCTPVRIKLRGDGQCGLLSITQDVGEAEAPIAAPVEGLGPDGELTVAFNPAYLKDGVQAMEGEEFTLNCSDAQKPTILTTRKDRNFRYLLMPVRVS